MKSSWAWMMVLVALGSGLIRAQPQIDVRKLSGTWYPLGTAWYRPRWGAMSEYKIQSNDTNSFELIFSVYSNEKCKEKRETYIAKKRGVFTIKGGRYKIHFKDTDYDNYLIMTLGVNPKPVLHLFGRKKVLTEEMKEKFQCHAAKMGCKEKYINYRLKILSCPL